MNNAKENHKFSIKITNFINPHMFHFKLESIVGEFDASIETRLKEYAQDKYSSGYAPRKDELVSAFIAPWNKWVRGQVDLILNEYQTKEYIVWCLDQGVAMKLNSAQLLPLPKNVCDLPPSSYTGGLAKCVPIEKRFNFATMEYETYNTNEFPEYLVASAKQLIEESAEIFFVPRQKFGDHIFGDIRITKYCGTKIDLLSELAKSDDIKAVPDYIPKGIENLFTTKKRRYENNAGNLNTGNSSKNDTTLILSKSNVSEISLDSKNMDDDFKMILQWNRQCSALAKTEEPNLMTTFDSVVRALDTYNGFENDHNPFSNQYFYHSSTSIANSTDYLENPFGSQSSIYECAEPNKRMMRLTEKLKATSLDPSNNVKPVVKKEPKKIAYIPSGYESDLVNFQKYNF